MNFFFKKPNEAITCEEENPFDGWTPEQIDAHMSKAQYGDFLLTDAIRPSPRLIPEAGYEFSSYRYPETGITIPVIMAAASREILFDLFMGLLENIEGDTVDVVLETSHDKQRNDGGHSDKHCDDVDAIALRSNLWDFEELLMDDGCTGIAVFNPSVPVEVQFDEHKLLIMYGKKHILRQFEKVLQNAGLHRRDDIRFISSEERHTHISREEFVECFRALQMRLSGDCDF